MNKKIPQQQPKKKAPMAFNSVKYTTHIRCQRKRGAYHENIKNLIFDVNEEWHNASAE